ncbi:MAG: permease prefix domain 1-containing protein [Phycisphaerales bacterium JB052]
MKHTPGNNPKPPTSRDGIETWLDVLTSMLSLPPSQRTQVRDELEDHLRSRVDDLLVQGKSEAEATRTAISELGETAQLARHISSANRTPKSFRRFAMNATFFVLAGSILTASVSMMMPTNTNTTVPAAAEARAVGTTESNEPLRKTFLIEREPAVDVLSTIAETFGMRFRFSDGVRRSSTGSAILNLQMGKFEGEFTKQEAIDAIQARLYMDYGETVLAAKDSELVLMTLGEYRREQIEIHAYPIPAWAESSDEQFQFGQSMQELLGTKHDLEYTTIQPVNGSLVVAAPPAVHAEINELAAQLKAISESMLEQREQQRIEQHAQMTRRIDRLRAEYEAAKTVYFAEREKANEFSNRIDELRSRRLFARSNDELSKEQQEALQTQINNLGEQSKQQEISTDEAKARFQRLQSILIDAESQLILSEVNDALPGEGKNDPKGEVRTVSIMGTANMRSGIYQLPEAGKLTLARFLMAADVQDPNSRVLLHRGGVSEAIGTVGDISSGTIDSIVMLPDDQVVVTAAE